MIKIKNYDILNSKETKDIILKIQDQYGNCPALDYAFLRSQREKLYVANREVFDIDLTKININSLGIYFAEDKNNEIRLSIEGSQIIGPHAKKNVVDISDEEVKEWLHGHDLDTDKEDTPGFVIIRNKTDFYGVGKLKNKKIANYVSKVRRLKG